SSLPVSISFTASPRTCRTDRDRRQARQRIRHPGRSGELEVPQVGFKRGDGDAVEGERIALKVRDGGVGGSRRKVAQQACASAACVAVDEKPNIVRLNCR